MKAIRRKFNNKCFTGPAKCRELQEIKYETFVVNYTTGGAGRSSLCLNINEDSPLSKGH